MTTEAEDDTAADPKPINAVIRALKTLEQFAESGERTLGVSELARTLSMSRSGVYRILISLRTAGFIEQDQSTSRYQLGVGALKVGMAYQRHNSLVQAADDSLLALADATGETATLSVRRGWSRVYLNQVPSHHELRVIVTLGVPYPLHAGASSKVILANMNPAEVDEYLAHDDLQQLTLRTIVDAAALRQEIDTIRSNGYATSEEERQTGAISAAAPLFSRSGTILGALSVTGPVPRLADDDEGLQRTIQLVVDEAKRVSAKLP